MCDPSAGTRTIARCSLAVTALHKLLDSVLLLPLQGVPFIPHQMQLPWEYLTEEILGSDLFQVSLLDQIILRPLQYHSLCDSVLSQPPLFVLSCLPSSQVHNMSEAFVWDPQTPSSHGGGLHWYIWLIHCCSYKGSRALEEQQFHLTCWTWDSAVIALLTFSS
jgi:hypothetical protein